MPVQGETSELPLPDILGMVRYRTGRLRFHSVANTPDTELYVSPGYITAMISGDRSITEEWRILDKLVAITASAEGSFSFEACAPSDLKQTVRVSIDGIMLAVVTNIDEILSSHGKMPNSSQLYRFTPGRETLTFDDVTLTAFLGVVRSDFELGVCATEIAKRLEINTKQVQFYFLKLIEFGMIEKMRAEDSPLVADPRLVLKSSEIKVDEEKLEPAPRPAPILSRESRSRHLPRKGKMTRLI